MILMMGVSLYTSRIVLSTLGIEDYGIYNVVGGFVAMFGFLNAAMSSGTQRYITFSLGLHDSKKLNSIFSTCVFAHVTISCVILVVAETIGLWFVLNKLSIPTERMYAAIWVYQCSIISSIIVVLSVPYNADIIAHEKMSAFAYISLAEVFLKLCVVFLLPVIEYDRVIVYASLLLIIQLFIRMIYTRYCHKHFPESHFHFVFNRSQFGEIISFSSWNLFGSISNALSTQGVNVVLNLFFGPSVNAARGIAVQVQGAVGMFASNFQMALNPQITKNYANKEYVRMHELICTSTKLSFFLLLCISAPICVGIHLLLKMWLLQVPIYTDIFVVFMLLITILEAMANPLVVSAAATGKIKVYQSVVGGLMIGIVPLAYIFLMLGGNPYMVFIAHIVVAIVAFVVRLYILRPMIRLSLRMYFVQVVIPCSLVFCVLACVSLFLHIFFTDGVIQTVLSMVMCFVLSVMIICTLGLSKREKLFILSRVKKLGYKLFI